MGDKETTIIPSGAAQKIAVAPDGTLWVSDYENNILHVRIDGSVISRMKGPNNPYKQSSYLPIAEGTLWLTDPVDNRVQHLAADGRLIAQFGDTGGGFGQFRNLHALTFASGQPLGRRLGQPSFTKKLSPKTLPNLPVEYDASNQMFYIDDVTIGGSHQLQRDRYRLLTLISAHRPPPTAHRPPPTAHRPIQ